VLLDLVLPPSCAGCGVAGPALCAGCAAPLRGPAAAHAPVPRPAGLPPLWAATRYAGPVRVALIGYKERNRRDLAAPLAAALAAAVRAAVPGGAVVLVPVPSRRAAARRRGGDHVRRLAGLAARTLGGDAVVCPALRPVGRLADAAGLSAEQRRASRVGALAVYAPYTAWLAARAAALPVVLVDDLVTTGATLAESAITLRRAGIPVAAAAVIAATVRNR
jgi:predicted amidophosphoribosyltransferase